MTFFGYVALLLFTLASPAFASDDPIWVVRVVDGDTLRVNVEQKVEKIRLHGIDAPEIAKIKCGEARFEALAIGNNPARLSRATNVDEVLAE